MNEQILEHTLDSARTKETVAQQLRKKLKFLRDLPEEVIPEIPNAEHTRLWSNSWWGDNFSEEIEYAWIIEYDYKGDVENESDAREDLADIMKALEVIFDDLMPDDMTHYMEDTKWEGRYTGRREFIEQETGFEYRLIVPWMPRNCEIKSVATINYEAVCAKPENE